MHFGGSVYGSDNKNEIIFYLFILQDDNDKIYINRYYIDLY